MGKEECDDGIGGPVSLDRDRKGGREDGPVSVSFIGKYHDETAGMIEVEGVVGKMNCVEEGLLG